MLRPRPTAVPASLRPYLLGLVLVTSWLWSMAASQGLGAASPTTPLLAGLLLGLSLLAYQFPVMLRDHWKVHVANSPLLAGAFLFSTADAMLLAALAAFWGNVLLSVKLPSLPRQPQRRYWYVWVLNAAQTALAVGVASGIYHLVVDDSAVFHPTTVQAGLALGLAGLIAYGTNTLAVAAAIALRRGGNPLVVWRDGRRDDWREELGLAFLAIVTALVAQEYPWAVLLQAGSIAVVQLSYRHSAQVRTQTKETIEHLAQMVDQRDPYTQTSPNEPLRIAGLRVADKRRPRQAVSPPRSQELSTIPLCSSG